MSALTISTVTLPSRPRLRLVPPRPAPAVGTRPAAAPVRSAPVRSTPVRSAPVRLTRRGRLAVTLVTAVLLSVAGVVGAHTASAGPTVEAPTPTAEVLVQPGQTLWAIAADVDPGADPREVIAQIQQLNGLETAGVQAGQTLVVPAG